MCILLALHVIQIEVQLCLRTRENGTSVGIKIVVCLQNAIKIQGARSLEKNHKNEWNLDDKKRRTCFR